MNKVIPAQKPISKQGPQTQLRVSSYSPRLRQIAQLGNINFLQQGTLDNSIFYWCPVLLVFPDTLDFWRDRLWKLLEINPSNLTLISL